jgi:hypothetical protein
MAACLCIAPLGQYRQAHHVNRIDSAWIKMFTTEILVGMGLPEV